MRHQINLTPEEIAGLKLDPKQEAAVRFVASKPGLMPSGEHTPASVRELIAMGLVGEGVKIVGLEGESQSDFHLTPAGEVWWSAKNAS